MPGLFDPLTIRSATFRNRIWVSPMCQYSVLEKDGVPRDWHLVHLGSLAVGGAGLVMAEATAVSPEGRISDEDTGIWNDEQRDAWARIVRFIHERGAVAGVQLAHAGRKASTWPEWGYDRSGTMAEADGGWQSVSASPVAFEGYDAPIALDAAGIDTVVADFASAAARSVAAGFDVVEVHAAHGYLLHQFLSPLSNRRDDEYGGSLANRARLVLRVVSAVREAVGDDIAVFVRFSATDWAEGGWDQQQTATVAGWARDAGADFFDISSGGLVAGASIAVSPGYQVPFAEYVRDEAGVGVCAVGLITSTDQAQAIVSENRADAVMLGRELLRDPHFPLHAAQHLGVEVDYWPEAYHRARPRPHAG
ncbi:NADH:flavin oxidoreductase/NADH oxidase [Microbacterium sp. STN6]|uniref:NADH:flavin oxidoreductase/NADH oxidase n=1 Tax=Microbacterium sp. STN6 TaxID=2995588 RepID=UPI0022608F2E|nr:NADH:flavin oxidoreductase/NADH oxidase [Microbacterium sp. STN6]MCX7521114.1 NADH:flavin oxidoreductase/NADH oxidase [Microbacterium sp. STN6]